MNNKNNKNIYRLIKPYQSNKVYEASSIIHGAGKCYKELKKSGIASESFSIINITDNSAHNFNIKQTDKMIIKKDPTELLNGGDELTRIKYEIEQLKNRISSLEKIIP